MCFTSLVFVIAIEIDIDFVRETFVYVYLSVAVIVSHLTVFLVVGCIFYRIIPI